MRAVLITRTGDQGLQRRVLFDTVAQRLRGFAEPTRFHF
jgi:protein-L-isoaspartate(D-aspartate) O-methyltransferase